MSTVDASISILISSVIDQQIGLGAAVPGDGPGSDAYLQEDGSSYILLEDGTSYLLLE